MITTNPQGPGWFLFFQEEEYHGSRQDKKIRKECEDEECIVMEIITAFLKDR